MNFDRDLIVKEFRNESADNLADIESELLALGAGPAQQEAARNMMRKLHNLKGGAAVLGFETLAKYTHILEDCLEPVREGSAGISRDAGRLLLRGVDLLRRTIEASIAGEALAEGDAEALLMAIAQAIAASAAGATEAAGESAASTGGPSTDAPAATAAPNTNSVNGAVEAERIETVRVDIGKLDSLLDLVTELTAAQGRANQLAAAARAAAGDHLHTANLTVTALQRELQERFMRLRLVRIGPLLHTFARSAHDMADRLGKSVQLKTEGEDTEVDVSVFTLLRDPLTHIVRNAIDHGLETAAERTAAGKPPAGTLKLRAFHSAGWFVVEVQDDGRGLDRPKILGHAKARGLVAADAAPTPDEIDALVFLPGFSTADTVSELSGRGVGMDVVKRNVESMRGNVSLKSAPGAGTTVSIRLPLTLAIMDGFVVKAGAEHYVVPLGQVVEVMEHERDNLHAGATGVFSLRGEAVPFIRLTAFYGESMTAGARENVVVVQHEGKHFGLVVERLLGEMQVVIKPLNRIFERLEGISGTTILGDGGVALLLDLDLLWTSVLAHRTVVTS
jgi:two-component system chemotaxis sensor kinase CheA